MPNQQTLSTSTASHKVAIVYHSSYGHTKRVAEAVCEGVVNHATQLTSESVSLQAKAIDVQQLDEAAWQFMDEADLIAFGCAVYMGSVPAEFKVFMDSSSKRWLERGWQGKWAAGFANSGGLSGDKLAVLQQLCLFAMQHGMNWVGLPLVPTGRSETDLNRLSSFLGLMTQSNDAPPELTPPEGDIKTATWFGEHLAKTVLQKAAV